ncbi:hypothetical protein FF38_05127 [Lucilia cuprina]|uniref:Uncharacterized protein n=1 Tax=Lucilia cuprina TaxID=7375 RepID=A0A0L0CNW8_LUCCU|nr:hypothetical protein FF38_05127 [Lucilia cuprina]
MFSQPLIPRKLMRPKGAIFGFNMKINLHYCVKNCERIFPRLMQLIGINIICVQGQYLSPLGKKFLEEILPKVLWKRSSIISKLFLKAKVSKKVGNNYYILQDLEDLLYLNFMYVNVNLITDGIYQQWLLSGVKLVINYLRIYISTNSGQLGSLERVIILEEPITLDILLIKTFISKSVA